MNPMKPTVTSKLSDSPGQAATPAVEAVAVSPSSPANCPPSKIKAGLKAGRKSLMKKYGDMSLHQLKHQRKTLAGTISKIVADRDST